MEMAIKYPTLAWLNAFNVRAVLRRSPTRRELGFVPCLKICRRREKLIITSNRLTETFHTCSMTRNLPYLSELVPEPYVSIPEKLA
ncbi:MAG: hypothetical protein ABDH61_04705 [Acidilobaceae archaeon]